MIVKRIAGVVAALICSLTICTAGQREIDYALEDAAVKTIQELTDRAIDISNIAFIGLAGDKGAMTNIFRSGLLRIPGSYSFFTRDDNEFNVLLSEIEFGDRRGDVMDPATIKRFGNIKGVDALLYGRVLEGSIERGKGLVRVTLTLADVETGQLLWSGNINGSYTPEIQRGNVPQDVIEASLDAGKQIAQKLSLSTTSHADIFLLPFVGQRADEVTEIISAEIISSVSRGGFSFFSNPTAATKNSVRNLSYKLAGNSDSGLNQAQLGTILKQLEQMYHGTTSPSTASNPQPSKAYLIGDILNVESLEKVTKITVTFKLNNCVTNQMIAGGTVTGVYKRNRVAEDETVNQWLTRIWSEGSIGIKIAAIAAAVIFGLILFFGFIRMMTGAR